MHAVAAIQFGVANHRANHDLQIHFEVHAFQERLCNIRSSRYAVESDLYYDDDNDVNNDDAKV